MTALSRGNNFDFIRFVAATMVLLWHSFVLTGHGEEEPLLLASKHAANLGSVGVGIFFVTSGFLLYESWQRKPDPVAFAWNRLVRIVPGLLFVLVFTVFVVGPLVTVVPLRAYLTSPNTYRYLLNLKLFPLYWSLPGCFASNPYPTAVNGSLWTIPYEILCYAGLLVVGMLGLLRERVWPVILAVVVCVLKLTQQASPDAFATHIAGMPLTDLLWPASYFSAGMAVAALKDLAPPRDPLTALSGIVVVATIQIPSAWILTCFASAYFVYAVAYSPWIPLNGFGKYGDFSYGMYLWGFPVQQVLASAGSPVAGHPRLHFAATLALTGLCAIASWRLVESPALRLKGLLSPHSRFSVAVRDFCTYVWRASDSVAGLLSFKRLGALATVAAIVLFVPRGPLATATGGRSATERAPETCSTEVSMASPALDSFLEGAWLAKRESEDYRWIRGAASVTLCPRLAANRGELQVDAYVPATFTRTHQLVVTVDDSIVETLQRPFGTEPWAIRLARSVEFESAREKVRIGLSFDGIQQASEADSREMSGLVSRVALK